MGYKTLFTPIVVQSCDVARGNDDVLTKCQGKIMRSKVEDLLGSVGVTGVQIL